MPACRHALSLAEPDDLVVICADEITAVWKEVIYHTPRNSGRSTGMQSNLPH